MSTFLGLALDQWLLIFTVAAAVLSGIATLLLYMMRRDDKKKAEEREAAEWLREYIETWDGDPGRVYVSSDKGEIIRDPQTDPSHFLEGSRGRKRLNRYCPGFWKTWVDLKDERKKKLDELYGFYDIVLSSLKERILSKFENILVNKKRLIGSINEDVVSRSQDLEGITFFMESTTERGATFRLRARGNNTDIARGDESSVAGLLVEIRLHQDLPITDNLINNLRQFDQDVAKDNNDFYLVRQKAIQSLETKFGLQRRMSPLP